MIILRCLDKIKLISTKINNEIKSKSIATITIRKWKNSYAKVTEDALFNGISLIKNLISEMNVIFLLINSVLALEISFFY